MAVSVWPAYIHPPFYAQDSYKLQFSIQKLPKTVSLAVTFKLFILFLAALVFLLPIDYCFHKKNLDPIFFTIHRLFFLLRFCSTLGFWRWQSMIQHDTILCPAYYAAILYKQIIQYTLIVPHSRILLNLWVLKKDEKDGFWRKMREHNILLKLWVLKKDGFWRKMREHNPADVDASS